MLHNEFPEGITDRSKATLRDTVRCIPSIFQSYSNWQLHSNVDIHLPLSNTSTQPNYTSLDNNHSASSVSQQGNLTSHACSNYLLEATKQRSNLLNQQQLAVFIGCFFKFSDLPFQQHFHISTMRGHFKYQIALYIYTCFNLKTKSQIQLTCQHIDDMQLEIRFVGVLLVSCQTKQKGSLGSGWMSDKSLSVAKSADGNT